MSTWTTRSPPITGSPSNTCVYRKCRWPASSTSSLRSWRSSVRSRNALRIGGNDGRTAASAAVGSSVCIAPTFAISPTMYSGSPSGVYISTVASGSACSASCTSASSSLGSDPEGAFPAQPANAIASAAIWYFDMAARKLHRECHPRMHNMRSDRARMLSATASAHSRPQHADTGRPDIVSAATAEVRRCGANVRRRRTCSPARPAIAPRPRG